MRLIIGLGNPGDQYLKTRHNAGWQVIDQLLRDQPDGWKQSTRRDWAADVWQRQDLVLVKPQTFMNESGRAVQAIKNFYKVSLNDIWVIHDDLDLSLGVFKIALGKGPKVHNGLLSVYQHLGSEQFWHVRVGVDNRKGDRTLPGAAYVLQPFSGEEFELWSRELAQISQQLWQVVTQ